ncbi:MAG: sigma-54-dependent Fis family transcriptional regulator, partial [Deltaproteobacteria bacterium]|nr:sigma-54-dependent Fis family transcriptional regulator [Deltaproteobacteria bacterium]
MSDPVRTITAADDGGARGVVSARQLVVVFAPGKLDTRLRLLDARPVVIGREPGDGGLALPDPEASRRHAEVRFDPARGWSIADLGSRNRLFVDGAPCAEAALVDGSVIRIGGSVLVFVAVDVRADAPLGAEDEHLLGASVRMQLVRGELAQVASKPLPVLLLGESGTGKERAARALHARSGRRGPLVTVNCAAIAPSVAESELFGHVAGAFTG